MTETMTDKTINDKMTDDGMTDDAPPEAPAPSGDAPSLASPALAFPGPAALWIGFIELEAWAEAVDPARPVFLLPVVHPLHEDGHARGGDSSDGVGPYRRVDLRVACQQVTPEGHVLYCLLRAMALARACDPVVDAHWVFQTAAWESLWECAGEMLEERGLRVLPAATAFPPGLPLVFGDAGGVRYDAALLRFRRVRPA